MSRAVFRIVDVCSRYAWWVIAGSLMLALACSFYTVRHFAIKTDVKDLFPPSLPWTQRALDYMKAFPPPEMLVHPADLGERAAAVVHSAHCRGYPASAPHNYVVGVSFHADVACGM